MMSVSPISFATQDALNQYISGVNSLYNQTPASTVEPSPSRVANLLQSMHHPPKLATASNAILPFSRQLVQQPRITASSFTGQKNLPVTTVQAPSHPYIAYMTTAPSLPLSGYPAYATGLKLNQQA
jgi:hypothetical protein